MKPKMIVMDMDDTLLNSDHSISDRTKQILIKAQAKGVYAVLASGRPVPAMLECAKELMLHEFGSFMISYNGAVIYDCKKQEIIFEQRLPLEILHEIHDVSRKEDVFIHTYTDETIVTDEVCEFTEFESRLTGMPIEIVDDFRGAIKGDVIKAMLLDKPEKIRQIHDSLLPWAEERLSMTISKPFFLEFMHKDADKGSSLERLARNLNIARGEIIAFGDSFNDISMLKYAGCGVAMGNAKDEVKNIADCITDCHNSDGIAKHLEGYDFITNEY